MAAVQKRNDFRVGPGTPLGEALRHFWVPACLSKEVAAPDCDPYRVRLLGQSLVAFRDSNGKVGILDEACPHRRASLVMGRNSNGGLSCLWHQWKFAVDGTILETPNVADCAYKERIKAKAYPVRESGGLIWTYLGPAEDIPPFPEFRWADEPEGDLEIIPADLDCSFIPPLEGLLDSSHVSLLHVDVVAQIPDTNASDTTALSVNTAPQLEVRPTDFGFHYAAIRDIQLDGAPARQVRVTAYAAPYVVFIASGNIHICVPQDDTHCRFYNLVSRQELNRVGESWNIETQLAALGIAPWQLELGGIASHMPDLGPLGKRNEFVQDRDAMREGRTYSGVPGLTVEDAIMTVSSEFLAAEGTQENLVPADIAIVRMRRWMNDIARRAAAGEPILETRPKTDIKKVAAASAVLKEGEDWGAMVPDHLPAADASAPPTRAQTTVA